MGTSAIAICSVFTLLIYIASAATPDPKLNNVLSALYKQAAKTNKALVLVMDKKKNHAPENNPDQTSHEKERDNQNQANEDIPKHHQKPFYQLISSGESQYEGGQHKHYPNHKVSYEYGYNPQNHNENSYVHHHHYKPSSHQQSYVSSYERPYHQEFSSYETLHDHHPLRILNQNKQLKGINREAIMVKSLRHLLRESLLRSKNQPKGHSKKHFGKAVRSKDGPFYYDFYGALHYRNEENDEPQQRGQDDPNDEYDGPNQNGNDGSNQHSHEDPPKHRHKDQHKHKHEESHRHNDEKPHQHVHAHEQAHEHTHEHAHEHANKHAHKQQHGHEHVYQHGHGDKHRYIHDDDPHQHIHYEPHHHSHDKPHQHIHEHLHSHDEPHQHSHEHQHSHDEPHQHSHEHQHSHDEPHQHSHEHVHIHEENLHLYDEPHQHSHEHHHSHEDLHQHHHNHDDSHQHSHSHYEHHHHTHDYHDKHGHQHYHDYELLRQKKEPNPVLAQPVATTPTTSIVKEDKLDPHSNDFHMQKAFKALRTEISCRSQALCKKECLGNTACENECEQVFVCDDKLSSNRLQSPVFKSNDRCDECNEEKEEDDCGEEDPCKKEPECPTTPKCTTTKKPCPTTCPTTKKPCTTKCTTKDPCNKCGNKKEEAKGCDECASEEEEKDDCDGDDGGSTKGYPEEQDT